MFSKSIPLFSLFGFKVRLDPSWFFLAVLIIWSLSAGLFPLVFPGLKASTYLWMALFVLLGLFSSIVLHEFAHAWVANRYGLPMRGITLFIFGGVAEMGDESPSPKSEFLMALAGPLMSVLLLILFSLGSWWGQQHEWPVPVTGVFWYLATMNGILILFNMVPAFPLDGGRVLRSALWAWKRNIKWATHITARLGQWFGLFLLIMGVLNILKGEVIGGIWWVILGLFLKQAAVSSYQDLLLRRQLEGETVSRFMHTHVVAVPSSLSVGDLVESYFYHYYFKGYPVMGESKTAVGFITLSQIRELPPETRASHTVAEFMTPISEDNSINAEEGAVQALSRMSRSGNSMLMVLSDGQLAGLLSLKDLLRYFALRMALEEK